MSQFVNLIMGCAMPLCRPVLGTGYYGSVEIKGIQSSKSKGCVQWSKSYKPTATATGPRPYVPYMGVAIKRATWSIWCLGDYCALDTADRYCIPNTEYFVLNTLIPSPLRHCPKKSQKKFFKKFAVMEKGGRFAPRKRAIGEHAQGGLDRPFFGILFP